MNYGNPLWTHIVETEDEPWASRPSHSMKMQLNSYRWLSEPAMKNPELGTYRPGPHMAVQFPKAIVWDQQFCEADAGGCVRGIAGAHTRYTDGKGTVADYVEAAQKAGLSFIIFNDPLEKLTAQTLAKLKADCAAINDRSQDFYACPGIEFTDGIGNRRAFWGESIIFPCKTFKRTVFTHT